MKKLSKAQDILLTTLAQDGFTVMIGWYSCYLENPEGTKVCDENRLTVHSLIRRGYIAPEHNTGEWQGWYQITDAGRAALKDAQ